MTQPLITVIVPCYKVEQYLPKCVDSILAQTYENLEIWLVDDGSPDRCGKICDEYAEKDERIKVIHKENGGLSDARNVAIDRATGEWITFVDSDDYVAPDYVEQLYGLCDRHDCLMAVTDLDIFPIGKEPQLSTQRNCPDMKLTRDDALKYMFNQKYFDVSACGKLYHRSLFSDIRFPKGMLFEDLLTTFRLMLLCQEGVAYSTKKMYYYMFRPGSIEGSQFSDKKMDSAIEVFRMMKQHESELVCVSDALKSRLASFCFHLILKMPKDYKRGDILYDYIRSVRWDVLTNHEARLKTRLGCLSTYLGWNVTRKLFSLVDRRR